MRTLLLLRHADTEAARPGHRDHSRRLTADGERRASSLGQQLRDTSTPGDVVLCSTAERARQTLALLGLSAPVEFTDRLYNAGADTILAVIRELPEECQSALVVGHAPGIGSVVYELADPATSQPQALAAIEHRFPAGTLARLSFEGSWSALRSAALTDAWLP